MKKNVFLRFFILSLFFVSCANPFKEIIKKNQPKLVTITMVTKIDGAVPSKMLSSINQSVSNSRTALPTLPGYSDLKGQEYGFRINAKISGTNNSVTCSNFSAEVKDDGISFEFSIEVNKSYDITISCTKNGTVILQGSTTITVQEDTIPNGSITLKK